MSNYTAAPRQHHVAVDASLATRLAPTRFWAWCSCGWSGPNRPAGGHAGRDGAKHAAAERAEGPEVRS